LELRPDIIQHLFALGQSDDDDLDAQADGVTESDFILAAKIDEIPRAASY